MLRDLAVTINNSRSPSVSVTTEGPPAGVAPAPTVSSPIGDNSATDMLYGPDDDDDTVSAFEGDSSLAAHTVFASEFLENTVTRTLPEDLDPDMQSALSSLQQIVSMQNRPSLHETRFSNAKPLPKGGIRELPMPPAHAVVTALREVKGGRRFPFAVCLAVHANAKTCLQMCR